MQSSFETRTLRLPHTHLNPHPQKGACPWLPKAQFERIVRFGKGAYLCRGRQ